MLRALGVGINTYNLAGANLQGCIYDIENSINHLITGFGFTIENIKTLLDADATTQNWKEALKEFVSGVNPGDTLAFFNSCHGSTHEDCGIPEGSFVNAVCPTDFDFSPEKMITDVFFKDIFDDLPAGVIFNWWSDSCHSANLDRMILRPGHKHKLFPGSKIRTKDQKRFWPFNHKNDSLVGVGGLPQVGFMSGCGLNGTSADAIIDGNHCGAFTTYMWKAWDSLNPNVILTDIQNKTIQLLSANGYDQVPSVDGGRILRPLLKP
jgi:hypothetical protein